MLCGHRYRVCSLLTAVGKLQQLILKHKPLNNNSILQFIKLSLYLYTHISNFKTESVLPFSLGDWSKFWNFSHFRPFHKLWTQVFELVVWRYLLEAMQSSFSQMTMGGSVSPYYRKTAFSTQTVQFLNFLAIVTYLCFGIFFFFHYFFEKSKLPAMMM